MRRRSWVLILVALASSACSQTKVGEREGSAESSAALAGGPHGKRVPPPEVAPLAVGKLRIEVVPWAEQRGLAHNGGYIAAVDSTGAELWLLEVYDVERDPDGERDVQDVFISSLAPGTKPDEIVVTDEKNRRYVVNVKARAVRRTE